MEDELAGDGAAPGVIELQRRFKERAEVAGCRAGDRNVARLRNGDHQHETTFENADEVLQPVLRFRARTR